MEYICENYKEMFYGKKPNITYQYKKEKNNKTETIILKRFCSLKCVKIFTQHRRL